MNLLYKLVIHTYTIYSSCFSYKFSVYNVTDVVTVLLENLALTERKEREKIKRLKFY